MERTAGETGWDVVAERIIRGLAHDVNNRLLALMGIRELGAEGLDPELLRLFDDELARLEATNRLLGRLGETPGTVDVETTEGLLSRVRELHARNSALRGVRTAWRVPPGLPAVRCDGVRVERALLRVLDASGRAAALSGRDIEVTARPADGAVALTIVPGPPGALDGALSAELDAAGLIRGEAADRLELRFLPA
ncbi:MAG: hypothetical protein KY466_00990 [Gemmatimonadetes bacterium]|nr:hypothetical protein [Gemmatimonadota bacterium]